MKQLRWMGLAVCLMLGLCACAFGGQVEETPGKDEPKVTEAAATATATTPATRDMNLSADLPQTTPLPTVTRKKKGKKRRKQKETNMLQRTGLPTMATIYPMSDRSLTHKTAGTRRQRPSSKCSS